MNKFGEFLYTLRKEKGITQAELAKELGVTNKAVSKWETGDAMPETSLLVPMSDIFGVTVDELLRGERTTADETEERGCKYGGDSALGGINESPVRSDGAEATKNDDSVSGHLFSRGKDETLPEAICGAVCAAIALLGAATYLIIGFTVAWTPYWVIAADCGISCGIVGIIFDLCNGKKRDEKIRQRKNPYTDSACGLTMLTCIIIYVTVSAFTGLWQILWIIPACGALACGIIAPVGSVLMHKKNKN